MWKTLVISIMIILVLTGCQPNELNNSHGNYHSTINKIYNESCNSNQIIVIDVSRNEKITTIQDVAEVKELINNLKRADWQENVEIDIRQPDFHFKRNFYTHNVWINDVTNRLELSIEGKSNYGVLSGKSSKIVFEILKNNSVQ